MYTNLLPPQQNASIFKGILVSQVIIKLSGTIDQYQILRRDKEVIVFINWFSLGFRLGSSHRQSFIWSLGRLFILEGIAFFQKLLLQEPTNTRDFG